MKVESEKRTFGCRSGFTLIELMIVVGIITILAAVGIPYFVGYHHAGMVSRCQSRLRALQTAREAYFAQNPNITTGASWENICSWVGSLTSVASAVAHIESQSWHTVCPLNESAYTWGEELTDLGTPPACPNATAENSPAGRHKLDL